MSYARGSRLAATLAATVGGRVLSAEDDPASYDQQRQGFNRSLDHRPSLILAAGSPADITAGIRFAAEHTLPVDIQATGHGAHHAMDGGLLITTRLLNQVAVDPLRRVAHIQAGATAGDVLAAAARYNLAAPVGSAPGVGFVSYSLGGGLGILGRRYGFAADHIRALEVVTADGRELTVTPDQRPDLYWALRGGGSTIAAVTSLEVALVREPEVFGGGLFFAGGRAADIIALFRRCLNQAPPELSLSIAFVRFPKLPQVPSALRERFCCHLRFAYLGDAATGERLAAPFRAAGPLVDTVGTLPITAIGAIHADPVGPMPVNTNSIALSDYDALAALPALLDPDEPFLLEVRHLGGMLSVQPNISNAVGHRTAVLNLFTSGYPGTSPQPTTQAQQAVYDSLAGYSCGGPLRNFLPSNYSSAARCYEPHIRAELGRITRVWDPDGLFGFAPRLTNGSTRALPTVAGVRR